MADVKISALSALTALEATDEFVVVEKSDTSMAASGTDKRITYASLVSNFTTVIRAVDYGVVANGADMLAGMNAAIAALNADNEAKLILPSGVIGLSAEPDAITGTDIAIESEGFTLLAMTAGAGAAGTFFTIGTSGTTANRVVIKGAGLRLQNNNTAPSGPQIEVAKANDVTITPGLTVQGGESILHIGTVASSARIYVGALGANWRGNLGGKVIRNIRGTNVTLEDWNVNSAVDANVAGSCYLEITAPDAGVHNDSGFYKNMLMQGPAPTQGAEKGIVVNSTSSGHIVNHWFVGGAFDGTQVSAVEIIENTASSTDGYIRCFNFDGTRFVTNAGKCVDLQRTNSSWIQDIQFNGCYFGFQRPTGTKSTSKPFTHTESAANKVLGVHYNNCHLRDDESVTGLVGKATIFSFGHSYWSLTGNFATRVTPTVAGACDSFFETTADVDYFSVTGNNAAHALSSTATFSVQSAYANSANNPGTRQVSGNIGPVQSETPTLGVQAVMPGFPVSAPASVVTGATQAAYAMRIIAPSPGTFTGIRYRIGAVSNGNVRCALYSSDGATKLADRTSDLAQGTANQFQSITFTTAYAGGAGLYYALIWFSSATATFVGGRTLVAVQVATGVGTTTPTTVTAAAANSDVPFVTTF